MSTRLKTDDGFDLHLHEWLAPGERPRLLTMILHGYGEHAGRYAHVAEAFNARGISTVAADLRGHGKSSGLRGHIESFTEYHRDADALFSHAKKLAGGAPIAVLAHSMGALLAADWMLAGRGKELAGVALSSPFLGLSLKVNPVKEGLGRVMSRVLPTLALPSGLKGSDACRDPQMSALYDADPLNNKKATARWFTEATKAIERVRARAGELAGPILLLYAGSDRIASADATDTFARKLRGADQTYERLADHYHEIMNETPEVRAKVIERIGTWLLARAEGKAA